jgi:hypothetical protein
MVAVLTNTSGHAFPTGTCRRTVELLVQLPATGQAFVAARLGEQYPGRPGASDLQPPLRPGERRTIERPLPSAATTIRYQLRYIRDRLNPSRYAVDILAGEARSQCRDRRHRLHDEFT